MRSIRTYGVRTEERQTKDKLADLALKRRVIKSFGGLVLDDVDLYSST